MTQDKREAAKTINEIYIRLRRQHFPKDRGLAPSPGSFNAELFKAIWDAGCSSRDAEIEKLQSQVETLWKVAEAQNDAE